MAEAENVISGTVMGPVVQAGVVTGGIHLHVSEPSLAALSGLPPADDLVGREVELSALYELLTPDSISAGGAVGCVVSGLPGVGKTALAICAARRAVAAGWFPGGSLFVDLQGYSSESAVDALSALGMLLSALGVSSERVPSTQAEREALFRSELDARARDGRRMLVVVDNASGFEAVSALRPGDPSHRMLVTSRQALPMPLARRVELDVLSVETAIALLQQCAVTLNPDGPGIIATSDELTELVQLCGRLPLALRIVTYVLSDPLGPRVPELVETLRGERDRLGAMTYGDSAAVRTSFDASYRRLPEEAARLFRLLSLIPGPHFSASAAGALMDVPESDVCAVLTELGRAHLLEIADGRVGYRFHDLLRVYAKECLRESREDCRPPVERLLDHYVDLARDAGSHLGGQSEPSSERFPDRDTALVWFNTQYPNLVAAVRLAAEAGFDRHAGALAENSYWFFDLNKRWEEWTSTHLFAITAARHAEDRGGEATMLNRLGNAHLESRRFSDARECYANALAAFQAVGDRHGQCKVLANMGVLCTKRGEVEEATAHYERALTLYREVGDQHGESQTLNNLGAMHRGLGRNDAALEYYRRTQTICVQIDDPRGRARALYNVGAVLHDMSEFEESWECGVRAVEIYRDVGARQGEALALALVGLVETRVGRFDSAVDRLEQALAIYRDIGDLESEGDTLNGLGLAHADAERFDTAIRCYHRAIELCSGPGDELGLARALANLGECYRKLGNRTQARDCYLRALEPAEQANIPHVLDWVRGLVAQSGEEKQKRRFFRRR